MPYRKHPGEDYETLKDWGEFQHYGIPFPSRSRWGFPQVRPYYGPLPGDLIPYNEITRYPDTGWAHFFLDDNKFRSVWTHPARSLKKLQTYTQGALGPDFSMYSDWPLTVQMHSWFQSCWCMALWQAEGMRVIPTICWSDEDSFEWCFQGLPREATVAVSTTGCLRNRESKKAFLVGFEAMLGALIPQRIVCYGRPMAEIEDRITRSYPSKWRKVQNGE